MYRSGSFLAVYFDPQNKLYKGVKYVVYIYVYVI